MRLIGSGEDILSLSGDHARPYIPQLTFATGWHKGRAHAVRTLGKSGNGDFFSLKKKMPCQGERKDYGRDNHRRMACLYGGREVAGRDLWRPDVGRSHRALTQNGSPGSGMPMQRPQVGRHMAAAVLNRNPQTRDKALGGRQRRAGEGSRPECGGRRR